MSYELEFLPSALKEWRKLGGTLREQFKKKIAERLIEPRVCGDALRGLDEHYGIKLRAAGYRLVYRVDDARTVVTVVAVGKRNRSQVYRAAKKRSGDE